MAKTPEERRASAKRARLWKLYRITPEEQDETEKYQRMDPNLRILLEKGNPKEKANLYTDHDHTTGMFRGRLAYLINKALGILEGTYKRNTPYVLRALALYLDHPPARAAVGERYGLIGRAKQKKKMIYGSKLGPLAAIKKVGKKK